MSHAEVTVVADVADETVVDVAAVEAILYYTVDSSGWSGAEGMFSSLTHYVCFHSAFLNTLGSSWCIVQGRSRMEGADLDTSEVATSGSGSSDAR